MSKAICEICGKPAIVHITSEEGGEPGIRHLCLECADRESSPARAEPGLNLPALLIGAGLFVLGLSLFADILGFGSDQGFGWQQIAGMAVAGMLVLSGALIRAPTLLASGALIGGITLLTDYLDIGGREGFGPRQIIGTLLGGLIALAGVATGRRRWGS